VIDFGGTLPGGNTAIGVSIAAPGVVFGRKKKGFTVSGVGGSPAVIINEVATDTRVEGNRVVDNLGDGFVADADRSVVTGNQAIHNAGAGFSLRFASGATLSGNLSTHNQAGILVRGQQHLVADNTAASNQVGISTFAGAVGVTFTRNVVTGSFIEGVFLSGDGHVFTRNALRGNRGSGILVENADTGTLTVTGNSFVGNGAAGSNCGLEVNATIGDPLLATGNFWGAASGPGADPADAACGGPVTAPFATLEIKVNPKLRRVD
jgi:nitrous oxidase accessory protein NosD